MITYDESGVTYDQAGYLYDGVTLDAGAALVIAGVNHTAQVADRSLTARVGSHGNSQGTLDAMLVDPSPVPATEDQVILYIDRVARFDGTLRASEDTEYRGGHLFAAISAEDDGPLSGLPSSAPFGLSDTPDDSTTFGYVSLRRVKRTTEGGATKTTYVAVCKLHGLWANQNVELTSSVFGLSAAEFAVNEVTVSWQSSDVPVYELTLGQPLVHLRDLILDGDAVPPGAITETKIADDSISTPKLKANVITTEKIASDAEIALVTNSGGDVVIDGNGLTITDGAMTLTNPSATVVIDGTSNMFKIVASGTTSHTESDGFSGVTDTQLTALGQWSTIPLCLAGVSFSNAATGNIRQQSREIEFLNLYAAPSSGASATSKIRGVVAEASVGSYVGAVSLNAYIRIGLGNWGSGGSRTAYARYQLCKEAAI